MYLSINGVFYFIFKIASNDRFGFNDNKNRYYNKGVI